MVLTMKGLLFAAFLPLSAANHTEYWLARRDALIDSVFGYGPGILNNRCAPDEVLTWKEEPGLQGLVWNMTTYFEITSTVFFSPVKVGQRSKHAFFFHHGHSNCVCSKEHGVLAANKCRPGCNSSMPSEAETHMPGYSWWDLYNVSNFAHSMGHDVFIFSMPLKGINLGPGSSRTTLNDNHWWFLEWEKKGDHALRYFIEPVVLTANYAKAQGYSDIYMAGLSGGGWSTTFAPAVDKRIKASFPIAGSVPCEMRNPLGPVPNQSWTGDDNEDFEQSCMPNDHKTGAGDDKPGRPAFAACNYTCQYLLAGLEPERYQVQILHEYDSCCFSPHGRHDQMLKYEANIRAELMSDDRASNASSFKHGWFTTTADNHVKHEVSAQDKTIIAAALAGDYSPGRSTWQSLPCDIMHQPLPANCPADVEPGYPPHVPASEEGFVKVGIGNCVDDRARRPAMGTQSVGNDKCEALCAKSSTCDAYNSPDWSPMDTHHWNHCRFYCTGGVGDLCTQKGNGGGKPTKTDNSTTAGFCWVKKGRETMTIV